MEVQGSSGESSEILITRFCKLFCLSHDDQQVCSFLKHWISIALQTDNAASVLGTMSDRNEFEETYNILFENLFIIAAFFQNLLLLVD